MRPMLIAAALLFASPVLADDARPLAQFQLPTPKEGYSYPECYCRDSSGGRVEVGQTACLTIGRQQVTSRCTKVRNLTIWRHQSEGCQPGV